VKPFYSGWIDLGMLRGKEGGIYIWGCHGGERAAIFSPWRKISFLKIPKNKKSQTPFGIDFFAHPLHQGCPRFAVTQESVCLIPIIPSIPVSKRNINLGPL
jgi:hypothetical protein